jgi:hypothetical protein
MVTQNNGRLVEGGSRCIAGRAACWLLRQPPDATCEHVGMSEHDSFEDRLRAMADQISQSVRRMSEVDLEEFAERYGIDAERARAFADAAGQWLSDRVPSDEPLFGQSQPRDPDRPAPDPPAPPDFQAAATHGAGTGQASKRSGPHPLDLPSGRQGLALSALDSGRWTVRPGSNQLVGSGEGPPPSGAADLVSELRARDWITADGALTLTGRHALGRWCRTAADPSRLAPEPDAPPE